MYRFLLVVVLCAVQFGCAYQKQDIQQTEKEGQSAPLIASASFLCAGQFLSMSQTDETALTIHYNEHAYILKQALSDDLSRYANVDQQVTWIRHKALATFQIGQQVFACHQLSDDLNFSAHGNEPFWSLDVSDHQAVMSEPDTVSASIPIGHYHLTEQTKSYESDDHALSVHLTNQRCQDDMSGMYYPMQANVNYQGRLLAGCAGNKDYVLAGYWKIVSLDNEKVVSPIPLTITFNDGQLTGSTGCNAFSGQYQLSGEALTIHELTIADKICGTEQGIVEARLVSMLKKVEQFSFDGDILLLYNDRNQVIKLERYGN